MNIKELLLYCKAFGRTYNRQPGVLRKLREILIRVLSIPVSLFLIIVIIAVYPLVKIKIGFLFARRLGHLAENTDLFLRKLELGKVSSEYKYIFFVYEEANHQIVEMFKRVMNLNNSELFSKLFAPICIFRTPFCHILSYGSNYHHDFTSSKSKLYFNEIELQRGKDELLNMGVPDGAWFVTIYARGAAYDIKTSSSMGESADYRNGDINSYLSAVNYIIQRGGYVIRMGTHVDSFLNLEHERYIDYSISCRSDFMDIYLMAKSRFHLGTASGLSGVSTIFDVPSVMVNWTPISHAAYGNCYVYLPKKVCYDGSGASVPFEHVLTIFNTQQISADVDQSKILSEYHMHLENNTEEEILEVVVEMFDRLDGVFSVSKQEKKLYDDYYTVFEKSCSSKNIVPPGKEFLKRWPMKVVKE